MKGNISLKDFIKEVKDDLKSAIDEEKPFFLMKEVELEVSFVLDAKATAGAKLVVLDIGGETHATQSHKVKIKLTPFIEESPEIALGPHNHVTPSYIPPVVYVGDVKNKRAITELVRNINKRK